ncbi:MAG: TonB family protein [Acidobacteria bacterium]|nr:TonB family protein [Acidobacteriota bacterium]
MTPHLHQQRMNVLDGSGEDLKRPFYLSLAVHGAVAAAIVATAMFGPSNSERWGSLDAAGGAVGVAVEKSIPLPQSSGTKNPLANDTESEIAPDKQKIKEEQQKEALEKLLSEDISKSKKQQQQRNDYKNPNPVENNQLTNASGNRVSSPLFSGQIGVGGVGVGSSTFGNLFGAYLQVVQERISGKWRPPGASGATPVVIVSFEILRDGRVGQIKVTQSGGNSTYDLTAQRAIVEAGPFEPLPAAYKGASATIEVAFKLQK